MNEAESNMENDGFDEADDKPMAAFIAEPIIVGGPIVKSEM
jgi:hypothetical protein